MRVEEMLTGALREEAESHEVDVTRLWLDTRGRLEEREQRPSRRRRLSVLAAAAAVAVAVTAGGVAVTRIDAGREPGPVAPGGSHGPVEGGVDDAFTCPEQITHDWTRPETVTDDYFVASLEGGPKAQAAAHDAPRYEFEDQGDRAFLRFGNADGTLATLSEFHRLDGQWTRYRTDVCVGEEGNIAVPVRGELSLGNHGGSPYDASELSGGPRKQAYLVDDRAYYDRVGLVRHRSIYAAECGQKMCLTSGDPEMTATLRLGAGLVPHDVSQLFLPPDEMPRRHNPYGLWALYDVEGTVESVVAYTSKVDPFGADPFGAGSAYVDGWPGQLHLVLAPFDQVGRIVVTRRPGTTAPGEPRTQSFRPQDLPGYDARVHR